MMSIKEVVDVPGDRMRRMLRRQLPILLGAPTEAWYWWMYDQNKGRWPKAICSFALCGQQIPHGSIFKRARPEDIGTMKIHQQPAVPYCNETCACADYRDWIRRRANVIDEMHQPTEMKQFGRRP